MLVCSWLYYLSDPDYVSSLIENKIYLLKGPAGEKGDQGTTEIIDYSGNIQEALQVRTHRFLFYDT